MEKIPPSQKSELDKLKEAVEEEQRLWRIVGLNAEMTVHPPSSLWMAKIQIRTLMNIIAEKGIIPEEELELRFTELLLEEMKSIRSKADRQRKLAVQKGPKIVDKFGREINLP